MEIALKTNGTTYKGWENISIAKSMQSIAFTFTMDIKRSEGINIDNNSLITILKDNKPFLVGYVDNIDIDIEDTERPMKIAGRSKAMDLIDCNILENRQYSNLNAVQIINDFIKDFNITVTANIKLEPLSTFNTEVGETYFNAINRLCKQLNLLPISTNDGNIELVKNKNIQNGTILKKFKSLKFTRNFTSRFNSYTFKQETAVKDISDGIIKDGEVKRHRPFVGVNTEDKTNYDMANWKKNNDISNSILLEGTITGWDLEINTIAKIEREPVNGYFLVNDIIYSKGDNGTISKVKFVDRNLFK